jgi:hypothetical protein
MNTERWNALVAKNEAHVITLSRDDRNALAEAAQHIEDMESACRIMRDFIAQNAGGMQGLPNLQNVYSALRFVLPECTNTDGESLNRYEAARHEYAAERRIDEWAAYQHENAE